MSYEFIQVTASKENGDFSVCSNLSLMDNKGLTPAQAEITLTAMAVQLKAMGYSIEWTREPLSGNEIEFWAPLFDGVAA